LEFLDKEKVKGVIDVSIHDGEMGYYSSSYSEFTGILKGDELTVELTIEIEDTIQTDTQIWTYTGDTVVINERIYKKVECEETDK
jgi:hypothetical protein